jgi:GH24 family phage-related lysozyme (muramidase)
VGNNILKYQDYILQEHYRYIDSLLIGVNESISTKSISNYLEKVFQRISKASSTHKKKILAYALSSLILLANAETIKNVIANNNFIKSELAQNNELKGFIDEELTMNEFKDPTTFKLSQRGWNMIKQEEGDPKKPEEPVLKAYRLGDGMITIGWGHAEKIKKSKYRVGQEISREEAQKLLVDDVNNAANGLHRLFNKWKTEGINVKINQNQYDVLVSMALNMGVNGLRGSNIIKELKRGNHQKAGDLIKKQNLDSKFTGLKNRRERESDMFLSFMKKTNKENV